MSVCETLSFSVALYYLFLMDELRGRGLHVVPWQQSAGVNELSVGDIVWHWILGNGLELVAAVDAWL